MTDRFGGALGWAVASLKERGIYRTTKVALAVLADLDFDLRYSTDTLGRVAKEALGGGSSGYSATKARAFRELIGKLDLPRGVGFVDLGCGKGRVLMLAALEGFERVVGVEYSSFLCAIARSNVKIFVRKARVSALIDVIETDVVKFRFEPEQSIFFLYNPFGEEACERMLANLEFSLAACPRRVWLIYNAPVHEEPFTRRFGRGQAFEIGGSLFKVYHV